MGAGTWVLGCWADSPGPNSDGRSEIRRQESEGRSQKERKAIPSALPADPALLRCWVVTGQIRAGDLSRLAPACRGGSAELCVVHNSAACVVDRERAALLEVTSDK